MANNISALGYLMNILNISINNLSVYLNLERSTVSKWKTGVRKFSSSSSYYDWVVEYLIEQNKKTGVQTLETLYDEFFPTESKEDPQYLFKCTNMFLAKENVPAASLFAPQKTAYSSEISLYKGIDGILNSIYAFFDAVKNSKTPGKIYITETEMFFLLNNSNPEEANKIILKVIELLNLGHKIRVIYFIKKSTLQTSSVVPKNYWELMFHPNFKEYIYISPDSTQFAYSYYIFKGNLSLSIFSNKNKKLYSTLYIDTYNITAHETIYRNILSLSKVVYFDKKTNLFDTTLKVIEQNSYIHEPLCLFSNYLNRLTMSSELFCEVVEMADVPQSEKQKEITLYNLLHISNLSKTNNIRHIYVIENLEEFIQNENLGMYIGNTTKPFCVKTTKKQRIAHIENTINYLQTYDNFDVSLVHKTVYYNLDATITTVCKNNLWYYSINHSTGKVHFNEDCAMANIMYSFLISISQNTSFELNDKQSVINKLKQIASL